MREWIPDLTRALDEEIAHIHREFRSWRTHVASGRALTHRSGPGVTAVMFSTSEDRMIATDTFGSLRTQGGAYQASVLESQPGRVVLAVEHPQGSLTDVHAGTFEADNTQLTEKLKSVLMGATDTSFNWDLLGEVAYDAGGPPGRVEVSVVDGLSADQTDAVRMALGSRVTFVQGPPGTGKTHTIGRIVLGALELGRSILVTSHTHVAVDQALLATLRAAGSRELKGIVRLGLPRLAEVPEHVVATNGESGYGERIRSSRAVFATLAKRYVDPVVLDRSFDVVLVDEVSMVNAALALPALGGARRSVILVGDPHQLPPIVQADSKHAKEWLGRDLFDLCRAASRSSFARLVNQRRMRPPIADISRSLRYLPAELVDHPSVERDVAYLRDSPLGDGALVPIELHQPVDTVQWFERSAWNLASAIAAVGVAGSVLDTVAFPESDRRPVGIITFFAAQRRLLTRLCDAAGILDRVLPGTVHTFQGNEVQVAILDPVLTKDDSSSRLRDPEQIDDTSREMNVMVSRARDQLAAVGDVSRMKAMSLRHGLGAMMSHFAGTPSIDWEPGAGRGSFLTYRTVDELLKNSHDHLSESLLVIGSKPFARTVEDHVGRLLERELQVAMIVERAARRPMLLDDRVRWIATERTLPNMLVSKDMIATAPDDLNWVAVRDRASAKLVSDYLLLTELLALLGDGDDLTCDKCGSPLLLETRRYGTLKGKTVLSCPKFGKDGCKGRLLVLRKGSMKRAGDQPDEEEKAYLRRLSEHMTERTVRRLERFEGERQRHYSGGALCRHRMNPDTCDYCNSWQWRSGRDG